MLGSGVCSTPSSSVALRRSSACMSCNSLEGSTVEGVDEEFSSSAQIDSACWVRLQAGIRQAYRRGLGPCSPEPYPSTYLLPTGRHQAGISQP